tara:strand:- start:219 stop:629 length:411 start_codon:yes stop_codon:yes gene_type:complete
VVLFFVWTFITIFFVLSISDPIPPNKRLPNGIKNIMGASIVVAPILFWVGLTIKVPATTTSPSSSDSASRVISKSQLFQIVKGCCSGVGGTYRSSYDEGCVVDSEQDKPFRDCVGKGKVKYPNGKIGDYYGSKFTR